MKRILLNNCSDEAARFVASLLGDKGPLLNGSFEDHGLSDFRMIVLESRSDQNATERIGRIRYACNFRNTPIVVLRGKEDRATIQHYVMAGATEVLSMSDPPAACRQILQGYLTPDRKPLEEEEKYLRPFIENTLQVIKTMAFGTAEFKEMYFANSFRIFGDISGIIGLSGAEGTVVLTFYWDLAWKIISRMMQVKEDAINAELIHDGVGEIINMIGGSTKKNFVGTPYHFELSLPTIVVGSGHQIGCPEGASIATLIFEMEGSYFALHVCLKPQKAGG